MFSVYNKYIFFLIPVFFLRDIVKCKIKREIIYNYKKIIYIKLICTLFWSILLIAVYFNYFYLSLSFIFISVIFEIMTSLFINIFEKKRLESEFKKRIRINTIEST